ncbi:hypothetical protein PZA11_005955 [Diplocarpon coronariae]
MSMWLKRFRRALRFRSEAEILRRRKAKEESASISFLAARVKNCPKCRVKVELSEGCDHVTCICSHQFCWLCLRPWGLRFHDPACRYFRPDLFRKLKMDKPDDEGLWLEAHNMVMINGIGVREVCDGYEEDTRDLP